MTLDDTHLCTGFGTAGLSRHSRTDTRKEKNLRAWDAADALISWHTSLDTIADEIDYLLIKLPKSLALLEDQLYRYRGMCTPKTRVIAAGMAMS